MKRITPQIKAIADAHIKARLDNTFDDPKVSSSEEVLAQLKNGKTFSSLMDEIEIRYLPITSILLARKLLYQSQSYKAGVYKGFKTIFKNA